MKTIIVVLLLTGIALGQSQQGITINIGQTYVAGYQDAYSLDCVGAVGKTTYQVQGLPIGASLKDNVIVLGK